MLYQKPGHHNLISLFIRATVYARPSGTFVPERVAKRHTNRL
jgi:hypothetical protein